MDHARTEDVERVQALVAARDDAGLDALLAPLHPADIAEIIQGLEVPEQVVVLKRLDTERAAEVMTEVDQASGQALLLLFSDHEVVSLLEEMPTDDAADIMSTLPREKTERVGALLDNEDREELQGLMEFGEETAGGIMEIERAAVHEDATIHDAIEVVRASVDEIENLQKIYIVNDREQLVGFINVLDLIVNEPATRVRDLMDPHIISVPVDMDQENVAALFGKYDEFTLPVVDADNKLVGRITVDDIIDVMEEEASEDIARIAGTTDDELGETSVLKVSRRRLPWLITGLVGEALNAWLMSRYEFALQTFVVLAFFVPLIVATAGNVGIQATVVVVREIALGQIDLRRMGRRVLKELLVAILNGVVLGGILFAVVAFWRHDIGLGLLLWTSLFLVILVAALVGSSVPLLLHRWRIDPAIATGPFITVSNDIIGLAIYLSLASVYLSRLH